MPSPFGVGCAYVCMGTWSSLLRISVTRVSLFFKLNDCHLLAKKLLFNLISTTMKKMLLTLWTVLLVTFAQAQEHMTFKDISMDCDLTTYISKLKAKGYKTEYTDTYGAVMSGNFAGKDDCKIYILCTENSKLVWKVAVKFPEQSSWSSLKSEYKSFKESYIQKYGVPESYEFFSNPYEEGDGYELQALRLGKCTYFSFYKTPLGTIMLSISDDKCTSVTYEDAINVKIKNSEKEQAISNDI